MDVALEIRRVTVILERTRIDVSTEAAAHNGIQQALVAHGFDVSREVRLDAQSRLDLQTASGIAIEVKIDGGQRRKISAQIDRYLQHPSVTGLILCTARALPLRAKLHGKPMASVALSRAWL